MNHYRLGLPSIHSRLHPKVMKILKLKVYDNPNILYFKSDNNLIFLMRGWDLAMMVATNRLDIAFCGIDTIQELSPGIIILKHYDQVKHSISLCARDKNVLQVKDRITVATEYPAITRDFLQKKGIEFEIIHVHGSTETFGLLNGIDAIVDIVETGKTLRCNGLSEIETLCYTYPCLITNEEYKHKIPGSIEENLRQKLILVFGENV